MGTWTVRYIHYPGSRHLVVACLLCLPLGLDPDTALVHQVNLLLNDLFTILGVLHRFTIQIKILGINGLLIEQLVEFGA
jgi:hypothetical protein